MKKLWTILAAIVIIILIGLGIYYASSNTRNNNTNNSTNSVSANTKETADKKIAYNNQLPPELNLTITEDGKTITYDGATGNTALDLLKKLTEVETKDTSFGPQIMAINSIKSTDKEFWIFSVNGQPASVGADQYQTKDGDKIEWKLTGM